MRPAEPAPARDGGRAEGEAGMVGKVPPPGRPNLGGMRATGRQEHPVKPCPAVPAGGASGGAA
eukprot:8053474-Alexandrium_andersonii.AAC.1